MQQHTPQHSTTLPNTPQHSTTLLLLLLLLMAPGTIMVTPFRVYSRSFLLSFFQTSQLLSRSEARVTWSLLVVYEWFPWHTGQEPVLHCHCVFVSFFIICSICSSNSLFVCCILLISLVIAASAVSFLSPSFIYVVVVISTFGLFPFLPNP